MQKRQGSSADTLRGVRDFLDRHAEGLVGVVAPEIRRELDDTITAVANHVASQSEGRLAGEGATRKQRALRRVLRDEHMAPIAAIAAAKLPATPEVEPLKMPPQNSGVAKLVAHAHGMAATATQHASVFTNAGLPATFADDLTGAADALVSARDEQTASRAARRGATNGLQASLARGRQVVRILDALVSRALKDDPALLASWKNVKRVVYLPARRSPAASNPSAPAAAVGAPVAGAGPVAVQP